MTRGLRDQSASGGTGVFAVRACDRAGSPHGGATQCTLPARLAASPTGLPPRFAKHTIEPVRPRSSGAAAQWRRAAGSQQTRDSSHESLRPAQLQRDHGRRRDRRRRTGRAVRSARTGAGRRVVRRGRSTRSRRRSHAQPAAQRRRDRPGRAVDRPHAAPAGGPGARTGHRHLSAIPYGPQAAELERQARQLYRRPAQVLAPHATRPVADGLEAEEARPHHPARSAVASAARRRMGRHDLGKLEAAPYAHRRRTIVPRHRDPRRADVRTARRVVFVLFELSALGLRAGASDFDQERRPARPVRRRGAADFAEAGRRTGAARRARAPPCDPSNRQPTRLSSARTLARIAAAPPLSRCRRCWPVESSTRRRCPCGAISSRRACRWAR